MNKYQEALNELFENATNGEDSFVKPTDEDIKKLLGMAHAVIVS